MENSYRLTMASIDSLSENIGYDSAKTLELFLVNSNLDLNEQEELVRIVSEIASKFEPKNTYLGLDEYPLC